MKKKNKNLLPQAQPSFSPGPSSFKVKPQLRSCHAQLDPLRIQSQLSQGAARQAVSVRIPVCGSCDVRKPTANQKTDRLCRTNGSPARWSRGGNILFCTQLLPSRGCRGHVTRHSRTLGEKAKVIKSDISQIAVKINRCFHQIHSSNKQYYPGLFTVGRAQIMV